MKKLSSNELGSLAFEEVKRMVLDGELTPGSKIVQERLAAKLGISRTPLRSALQMLEAEYLVESIPRRGVYVKSFTDQEIIDVFDCRIALECQAVRTFTEKASEQQVLDLALIFEPFRYASKISITQYREADVHFHNAIIEGCGNPFLTRLFSQGNLLMLISRIGLIRPPRETLPEHFQIVAAIESRNPALASAKVRAHLVASQDLLLKKINRNG